MVAEIVLLEGRRLLALRQRRQVTLLGRQVLLLEQVAVLLDEQAEQLEGLLNARRGAARAAPVKAQPLAAATTMEVPCEASRDGQFSLTRCQVAPSSLVRATPPSATRTDTTSAGGRACAVVPSMLIASLL